MGRPLRWCAVAATLVLGGCAATGSGPTVRGQSLTIYVSDPPSVSADPQAQDVVLAEELAFSQLHSQVKRFQVSLARLTNAKISDNARTAVKDSHAIAYVGEIAPGASADSVGITNALDLLQVSPTDNAAALTQKTSAVSGSPDHYYQSFGTYGHTFARMVPATNKEAAALVSEMRSLGITQVRVQSDGSDYGETLRLAIAGASASATDGLVYAGTSAAAAERALNSAVAANPKIKLFVPSALADPGFVSALSPAAQRALFASVPAAPSSDPTFASAFRTAYGHAPAPEAIFGYAAMQAVLDVLQTAGSQANSRSTVLSHFLKHSFSSSALGPYSIDKNGDISLTAFAIERVKAGRLVPVKTLQG
jgi:branched-chain amino acid transport system substrate-binding protein